MARMSRLALTHLAAVAQVRWRIFSNRLRSRGARFELFSKVLMMLLLLLVALGPAIGLAFAANHVLATHRPALLAAVLWVVLVAWQLFPTIIVALTDSWDPSTLRRFPMSPFIYSIVWTISGALDPSSFVAGIWLIGIFAGIASALPAAAPWAAFVLFSFALMNLLLSRLIAAWLSRWLAQRRTREIIGVLFMLVAIGNQLIAKIAQRYLPHYLHSPAASQLGWLSHILPPGLAANSITSFRGQTFAALASFASLCAYIIVFAVLLSIRIRAEYFGENLSETARRSSTASRTEAIRPGIEVLGAPYAVSAVFEKELRALLSSPQFVATMLFVPPLVLLVFGKFGASSALSKSADLGLAFGLANAVLALTRVIYNNLGIERSGVQFYYFAPVRFRQVVIGKNLAHATILFLQCLLVIAAVILLFGLPSAAGATLAFVALLFAVTANITVGNVFSLRFPRKEDFGLNRRSGSAASALAALGVQLTVMAIAVPLFFALRNNLWLGTLAFATLFALAFAIYLTVLTRIDRLATRKSEVVISGLCR